MIVEKNHAQWKLCIVQLYYKATNQFEHEETLHWKKK